MVNRKGKIAVYRMLRECGISNITEIPLELLVAGRGLIMRYSSMKGADGRIVFGNKGRAIITINSGIEYEGKRRFTIAHELGHFEMHKHIKTHNDSDLTLNNFINNAEEAEANQFATELLLPEELFKDECSKATFSPNLLRKVAEFFNTSLTSVAYRYLEVGNHPIFIFHSQNNQVKYWKNSEGFFLKVKDVINLPPPKDSVAYEFFSEGKLYKKEESIQKINKSTWFELGRNESDKEYYEFCIITPRYSTVLSIVWEK